MTAGPVAYDIDFILGRLEIPDRDWDAAAAARGGGLVDPALLQDGDQIIQCLDAWGYLSGRRTGDGGWRLNLCPWDAAHTTPGDNTAAVYLNGRFNCFHHGCNIPHKKTRHDFIPWFNERMAEETGGLMTSLAVQDFDAVEGDPASGSAATPGGSTGAAPAPTPAARAFLSEMIWITAQSQFFSRRTRELISQAGVDGGYALDLAPLLMEGRRQISVSHWFFRDPRRIAVDDVTFWPGDAEVFARHGVSYANRWRACSLGTELAESGLTVDDDAVRPWLDVVWHVLGNEGPETVSRVLDWMALVVGAPGTKPGWHVLVQGAQGIGKDLLMQPVKHATGAGNWVAISPQTLGEPYNSWAEKRLVLVSEQKQTTNGSASGKDQYGALKIVTENTSETIWVRPIYAKRYEAKNVCALYISTNEGDAVALDHDDRRFLVAASTAVPWPEDAYDRVVDWMGGESGTGAGTELVAAWLLQRWATMTDARRRRLQGRGPDSASKQTMTDAADPVRAWTREQIEDGVWPDLMTKQELDERFRAAVRNGAFRYPPSEHRRGALLRELGGDKVYGGNQVRLLDGRKARMWAVRRPEQFSGKSEATLAKEYERLNAGVENFTGFASVA